MKLYVVLIDIRAQYWPYSSPEKPNEQTYDNSYNLAQGKMTLNSDQYHEKKIKLWVLIQIFLKNDAVR